ncbi:sialic acid-binding Ig-like lectin 13 isoform X2 [Heterodontus francisci]|uniref:sialic acid-binding Ig-like lectin 13 isoform X2 n=1 Tax=Heterodontus francisci TaxID=7792 RepID=UPI00355C19A7
MMTFVFLMTLTTVVFTAKCSVVLTESMSAVAGSCADIRCTFDNVINNSYPNGIWIKMSSSVGNPSASVIYNSKDPHKQHANYSGRVVFTGNLGERQCSLLIKRIRKSDEGTYQFILTFGQTADQHSEHSRVVLSVSEKPRISGFRAMVAGRKARLTCSVTDYCPNSKLQVKWSHDNMSLPLAWDTKDGAEIINDISGSQTVSSVLTLIPSSAHQGSILGCTIIIGDFQTSSPQTLALEIKYKPTIVGGPTCISSENWTNCTCTISANPPANITWKVNDSVITGNRSEVEVISWEVNSSHVQSSLRLAHPTGIGNVISCVAANEHGDCVGRYQLHSDGITSWKIVFMILGGASGLLVLISVVIMVKNQTKKLKEDAGVIEMQDDLLISSSVQNALNTEIRGRILVLTLTAHVMLFSLFPLSTLGTS